MNDAPQVLEDVNTIALWQQFPVLLMESPAVRMVDIRLFSRRTTSPPPLARPSPTLSGWITQIGQGVPNATPGDPEALHALLRSWANLDAAVRLAGNVLQYARDYPGVQVVRVQSALRSAYAQVILARHLAIAGGAETAAAAAEIIGARIRAAMKAAVYDLEDAWVRFWGFKPGTALAVIAAMIIGAMALWGAVALSAGGQAGLRYGAMAQYEMAKGVGSSAPHVAKGAGEMAGGIGRAIPAVVAMLGKLI